MLETFFYEEDISDIYRDVVMYSVLRYGQLDIRWRNHFLNRYQHALSCFGECQIDDVILKYETVDNLKVRLDQYQEIYHSILDLNKEVVDQYGPMIEKMIVESCPKKNDLGKIAFLFDFVTHYVHYSNDYFKYCLQTPPVDGYSFDFQDCVPVDSSMNGMFVMGQGVCDDIANLMICLGRSLNLNMGKVFAHYRGNLHSFNSIVLDNQVYYLDATRVIRGDMLAEDCFLVGGETLNKNGDYYFENSLASSDYVGEIPDYSNEVFTLLDKIEEVKPRVSNLSQKKR